MSSRIPELAVAAINDAAAKCKNRAAERQAKSRSDTGNPSADHRPQPADDRQTVEVSGTADVHGGPVHGWS